jgi:GNAT superfamily N-acetyltransferase
VGLKILVKMTIRPAVKTDMKAVLALITELAIFEKEPDAVEVTEDYLINAGFGNNPEFKCFVAEIDAEIVGMALVFTRFSTWKGTVLHLEDLIVNQKYRGQGIGAALLDKVVAYGKELGVKRISWEVLDWNTGAIEFYKQKGANILETWRVVHLDKNGINNYNFKN